MVCTVLDQEIFAVIEYFVLVRQKLIIDVPPPYYIAKQL